jgi:hypothetical protein
MACRLSWAALTVLMLTLTGCGSEHDKVKAETISVADDFGDILAGIKTADDMKSAMPKLEALGQRVNRLNKRRKDLPVAEQDKIEADLKTAAASQKKRVETEMQRISKVLGVGAVAEIMRTLQVEAARVNPY